MKTYGDVGLQPHAFLASALDGGELLASNTCFFNPGERDPGTIW